MSLGVKYNEYCSSITRTLLLDPTAQQKEAYLCLPKSQEAMIEILKQCSKTHQQTLKDSKDKESKTYGVGAEASKSSSSSSSVNTSDLSTFPTYADVYSAATQALPEYLQSRFVPAAGFALGIEFRDSLLQINPKNSDKKVRPGSVVCLSLGTTPTPESPWALWVTDTVADLESGPLILTQGCKRDLSSIQYARGRDSKPAGQGGTQPGNSFGPTTQSAAGSSSSSAANSNSIITAAASADHQLDSLSKSPRILELINSEMSNLKRQRAVFRGASDSRRATSSGAAGGVPGASSSGSKRQSGAAEPPWIGLGAPTPAAPQAPAPLSAQTAAPVTYQNQNQNQPTQPTLANLQA